MLSSKARYGLKAMAALARRYQSHQHVPVDLIAQEEHAPVKFLEAILTELRKRPPPSKPPGTLGRLPPRSRPERHRRSPWLSAFWMAPSHPPPVRGPATLPVARGVATWNDVACGPSCARRGTSWPRSGNTAVCWTSWQNMKSRSPSTCTPQSKPKHFSDLRFHPPINPIMSIGYIK